MLRRPWRSAGVARGDVVYLSTQLFGLGALRGAVDKQAYCAGFYDGVRTAIGSEGTLVVPTFTQQVGRFGLQFIHEETPSLTGIFGEHVRQLPGAMRSLHPVFSVSAIGPQAAKHHTGHFRRRIRAGQRVRSSLPYRGQVGVRRLRVLFRAYHLVDALRRNVIRSALLLLEARDCRRAPKRAPRSTNRSPST